MTFELKRYPIVRTDMDGTVRRIEYGTEEYVNAENTIMRALGCDSLGLRRAMLRTRGTEPLKAEGAKWHFVEVADASQTTG